MSRQMVVLFRIEKEKRKQIQKLCNELEIITVDVPMKDYAQKLGYLAKVAKFNRENRIYEGPEFPAEMLVFSGMNSDEVDVFLAEYKKSEIAPIGLKAIVTPTNASWTADELFRELMKEHAFFKKS